MAKLLAKLVAVMTPKRRWAQFSLATMFVTLTASSGVALSQDTTAQEHELPRSVAEVLGWFPENTETVVVAQSFELGFPDEKARNDPLQREWTDIPTLTPPLDILAFDTGVDQFDGRKVVVSIDGGREFEVVSAFGSLRYEGCDIVVFEEELGDAGRHLIESVRKRAKAVRSISGADVFVLPDRTRMESIYELKPWQGTFIALPKPNILLCATSDTFIQEVLERMLTPRERKRALPPDLPEWQHVDIASPAWSVRHIPTTVPGQVASGVVWSLKPRGRNVFEIVYLPVKDAIVESLIANWVHFKFGDVPEVEVGCDGTLSVRFDVEKHRPALWFWFPLYGTRGESGVPVVEVR